MKRKFLLKLIAVSISIVSISTLNVTSAYADNYNTQLYYGSYGKWKSVNGLWYFYDYNNNMKTGWVLDKGNYYFLNDYGVMQKGVVQVNGKVYLFNESGAMQVGSAVIDGVMYEFDSQGALIGDKYPAIGNAYSMFGERVVSAAPDQIITGESSTPDDPSVVDPDFNKSTKYTVEFRNEDGDTIKSQSAYKGEKIVLYKPVKAGYDFDSWSTESDGDGKTYDALSNFTVNHDTVLYGNWTEIDGDDDDDDDENKPEILADAITITSNKNIHEINEDGGSLQLTAEVVPEKTTNKSVTWSIEKGDDIATIDSDGLLSAKNNGEVTVIAKAKDGSGTVGRTVIKVNGQHVNQGNDDNKEHLSPEKPVKTIEITSEPRLNYDFNEKIDLSNLKVKIHYSDGSISDEIPYSDFSKYAVYVKNYRDGQELEKSYVARNKYLVISCGDKIINSPNLNMKIIQSPKVITNDNTFDKYHPNDCIFKYTDGTNENSVKNVVITENGTALDSSKYTVDYEKKEIKINKDYINSKNTGILTLFITLNDSNNSKLSSKVCTIKIEDTEIREAPNNFIRLEKGSKNKYTKLTILKKSSDGDISNDANYSPSELEYCITDKDLSVEENESVTWKAYNSSTEQEVTENSYLNIRKKADKNSNPSRISSKKITQDYIAKISSAKTIKSFKLKDSAGNIYDSIIDSLQSKITVIVNSDEADVASKMRSLMPIIEYEGTAEDVEKINTSIGENKLQRSEVQDTVISYSTSSDYSNADNKSLECIVTAEDKTTKSYNIKLYVVKQQEVQMLPSIQYQVTTTTIVADKDTHGEVIKDKDGNIMTKEDKTTENLKFDYGEFYPTAGIGVYLESGKANITVIDPLKSSQSDYIDKMKKDMGLKGCIINGNINVGLMFDNIPQNTEKIKVATSLEGLTGNEESICLNATNDARVENKKYIQYINVANLVPTSDGKTTWQYIHHGTTNPYINNYYYKYLDSANNVIGYSKLAISLCALNYN